MQQTSIFKRELDTPISILLAVSSCKSGRIEVVPYIINLLPTTGQCTVNSVVVLTSNGLESGSIGFSSATTNELIAGNFESMSGSRNGGSPLYNGVTTLTEGSAGVAVLHTGGSLVGNGHSGMNVGGTVRGQVLGIRHAHRLVSCVHLGIHMELFVGEGAGSTVHKGDEPLINVHLHILCEEVVSGPVGLSGETGNIDVSIKVNDTNRKLSKNRCPGIVVDAGASDSYGSGVGFLVDSVFSGEALCKLHVIELPVVYTVKVDHSIDRLNSLDIGCFKVHPINRTERNLVEACISGNELNSGLLFARLNLNNTDNNRLVACVITNLKLYAVVTVCNLNTGRGKYTVSKAGLNLNAVNVYLRGRSIKAGNIIERLFNAHSISQSCFICYSSRKIKNVVGSSDNVALNQSGRAVQIDLIKDGIFSVVNCLGVVYRKAIKVVGVGTVDGTVFRPQNIVFGSVCNDRDEELTLLISLAVAVLKIKLVGILQCDLLKSADVHGHIIPAGLVDIVVYILGFHHADGSHGIINTVSVGVGHIVTLHPALDVILGHVEPETDSASIFKDDCITINTKSDPSILTGVRFLRSKTVDLKTQRIITVVNLSVGAICQRQLQIVITIIIGSAVDDVPLINVDLTVLKVPKNLGTLAKVKLNGSSRLITHIKGCSHSTCNIRRSITFIYSNEVKTTKAAKSLIRNAEGNVIRAKSDLLRNAINGSGCLYRDLGGLPERNRNHRLLKVNLIRGNDGNGLFTHDLAVIDHLCGHSPLGAVGGEHTVNDGTHAGLLDLPLYIGGNLHLGTDGVSAEGVEGNGCAGGVVVIVGGDGRLSELTVCGSSRNDQNGVGGWTLTAVGQRAVNLQVFTGTLRAEGSRTTTVTVSGDDTTHLDHVLSHFIRGEPGGVGSLLTVGNGDHKTTVRPNTNEGSGCDTGTVGSTIVRILVHGITIVIGLDQEAEQYGDRLLFPAGQRIGRAADPRLGHIRRSFFTGNGVLVVVDNNDGLYATAVFSLYISAVRITLTVQDGITKRLTDQMRILLVISLGVPAQRAVGSNNYVAVAKLFCFQCLSGGRLGTVVAFLRPHTLSTGNDLNILVVNVHHCGVNNLPASTGIVVQNLLVLCDTGSEVPFFFGNDIVIVTSAVAVIVDTCCQNAYGQHAYKHKRNKQHCQKT